MTRLRNRPALAVLGLLVTAAVAWAFWTVSGVGTGNATVGALDPATITVPPTSTGTHDVTWTVQATTGNATLDAEIVYTVERKEGLGAFAPIATGGCAGDVPHGTTSCSDTVGASGAYTYRVVAEFRTWTATSADAGPVAAVVSSAPTVSSINRAASSPTNNSSVSWTVTFSENVNGADATDFDLVQGGSVSGASISSVTPAVGPEDVYTVTASTGSGSGTLGLDLDDDDTIQDTDAVPNSLGGLGANNGDFTGEVYAIDKTPPTVQSINRIGDSLTNAGSVEWTVTFSEDVSNVDAADFNLVQGPGVTGALITDVDPSGGSEDVYTVTAGTGTGSGTLGLNLVDDDSIEDSATNKLGGTGNGNGNFTGQTFTLDKLGPTVQSINRAGTSPTNAGSVSWTVVLSESSAGVDQTDFALAPTGLTGASITGFTPESGTTYTITANTGGGSGTLGLNLVDDDSITDQLGNKLGGTGISGPGDGSFAGQLYTLDRTPPTVQSITRVGASPTNASSVSWTVAFSENVTGVGAADFDLVPTGLGGTPAITGVASVNASTYTVTASTGSGNGTLGLDLDDDDTIADSTVGNKLGGTGLDNGDFTGEVFTFDRAAPQLQTLEMHDTDVDGRVDAVIATFNEALASSTNNAPWTLSNIPSGGSKGALSTSGSTATLLINEGAGAQTTAVGSFTVALAANATGIRDAVGNQSSFATQAPTDKAAPIVTAINRVGTTPTNAATAQFTATFSESVTGVGTGDFATVTTGTLSGTSVTSISGSGASYTLTTSTGTGDGTLGLNLVDDDSIQDVPAVPNKLGGAGTGNGNFTGQAYTIDRTAPQLQTLEMRDADADGRVDRVVATYNEALQNTTNTTPWTIANHPSGGAKDSVSATGNAATLVTTEGSNPRNTAVGTFTVAYSSNATGVRDLAGNLAPTYAAQSPLDDASPVPTAIADTNAGTAGRFDAGDTLTITFSENVSNSATTADVALNHQTPADTLAIPGLFEGTTAYDTDENGYITAGTATFPASPLSQPATNQVRVTLTACNTGCAGLGTESSTGDLVVVPSTTIEDGADNTALQNSALPTFSINLF